MSEEKEVAYAPIRHAFQEWVDSRRTEQSSSGIPGFITEHQLAEQLDITLRTVRSWRKTEYGPRAVTIGKRVYYREDAAETFAAAELKKAESAAQPPRRGRPRK